MRDQVPVFTVRAIERRGICTWTPATEPPHQNLHRAGGSNVQYGASHWRHIINTPTVCVILRPKPSLFYWSFFGNFIICDEWLVRRVTDQDIIDTYVRYLRRLDTITNTWSLHVFSTKNKLYKICTRILFTSILDMHFSNCFKLYSL